MNDTDYDGYVPTKLRKRPEPRTVVEYAIGLEAYGEVQICHGPGPLEKMLETVPEMVPAFLYRVCPDRSNVGLYEWKKDHWERVKE